MRRGVATRRGSAVRSVAAVVTLAATVLASPAVALAQGGLVAAADGSATVTTATWAAVATQVSAPPYPTGPLTLTFAAGPGGWQLFDVVNTGTVPLTGASYAAVGSGGVTPTLTACLGGSWNTKNGSCVGGKATVLAGASTVAPATPGAAISVECAIKGRLKQPVTVTISVSVTNGTDTPAGTVTNG